jgi:hypothetical protein
VTHAPKPVVIFVATGDNGVSRRSKPDYRQHRVTRKDAPWPVKHSIPQLDRTELRRRVEEHRRATRQQVEGLKAAGREFRAAIRPA